MARELNKGLTHVSYFFFECNYSTMPEAFKLYNLLKKLCSIVLPFTSKVKFSESFKIQTNSIINHYDNLELRSQWNLFWFQMLKSTNHHQYTNFSENEIL